MPTSRVVAAEPSSMPVTMTPYCRALNPNTGSSAVIARLTMPSTKPRMLRVVSSARVAIGARWQERHEPTLPMGQP